MKLVMRQEAMVVVILAIRNIRKSLQTPLLVVASLLQPVLWLVMFSQTFRGLGAGQLQGLGFKSYLGFFAPSMVVLAVLFTALQSGMATMTDIDRGMLDKFRIIPMRRFSILLGRVIADAVTMLIQGGIVLVVALVMGAGVATGLLGAAGILFLAALLGVVWACVTNLIALSTKSSELTMVGGLFVTLPVLFLSSAFFPLKFQPDWLQAVAKVNPAAYVISAEQLLMNVGNDRGQDLAALAAVAVTALILVPATVAAFRTATR
jgi:ABC-2 type transport system permease protein